MKFPSEKYTAMHIVPARIMANTSNLSGTETTNTNSCDDGILIISLTKGTTGIQNIGVHTSATSSFTESTSNICTLTQDIANSTGTFAATSGSIATITATGVYVYEVHGLKKYINIEYDGKEADSYASMVIIGINPSHEPTAAARSVYS